MKTVSRSKITSFIVSLAEKISGMNDEERRKSESVITKIPVSNDDLHKAAHKGDQEFIDTLAVKFLQRYEDTEKVMFDAVNNGAENVDDLCDYLGIPHDSPVEEIVYRSHAHQRLSGKGLPRPEAIKE